jgi:hypothetical protein
MIKKLSFSLAALVVLALIMKITMILVAVKASEQVRLEAIDKLSIDYGNFSVAMLSGEVHYQDISIKLFELKREVKVDRLSVDFGSAFGLVIGLPALYFKDPSYIEGVRLEAAQTAFFDTTFYEWLDGAQTSQPELWSALFSCSGVESLSEEDFNKMGIERFTFDLDITLDKFAGAQPLAWSMAADIEKIARIQADWSLLPKEKNLYLVDNLSLNIVEQGFFRRIYNSCEPAVDRENFATGVVSAWQTTMGEKHIRLSSGLSRAMRDYLLSGGQIQIRAKRDGYKQEVLPDEARELTADWNLVARVNQLDEVQLNAYYEPPIIVAPIAEPPKNSEPLPPTYSVIEAQDLELMTGKQLKLSMSNEKVFEGIASKVGPYYVELTPIDGDGKVSFSLKRADIVTVEVWQ